MGYRRKLIFEELESGCVVCTSHSLNQDGYLRISDYRLDIPGHKPMVMHHRLVWESVNGPIPDGYEIDHICRNRACQNISHLQMLTGREHTIKTNIERKGFKNK